MARGRREDEFPKLKALGLRIIDIPGDGNCLFSSLSDQIYGNIGGAKNIRARVVEYMRENPDSFKAFIHVPTGGGHRRNPKRKNVAAPPIQEGPTPAQIDVAWENYLSRMACNGEYGDNVEIQAFARAYNTDVKIYKADHCYFTRASDGGSRPVAHIALHEWEHYSSIRNIAGPFEGHPNVQPLGLTPENLAEVDAQTVSIPAWRINAVERSLPWAIDEVSIRKALCENRGNVNAAVTSLLEDPSGSATSLPSPASPGSYSQSGASSIERDPDSDDEEIYHAPKKRQDRRKSRAIRQEEAHAKQDSDIPVLSLENPGINAAKETPSSTSPITILPQPTSLPARTTLPPLSKILESTLITPPLSPHSENHLGFEHIREPKADSPDSDASSLPADGNNSDSGSSSHMISLLSTAPPKHPKLIINHIIRKSPEPEKKPRRKLITAREKKDLAKKAQKEAKKDRQRNRNKQGGSSPAVSRKKTRRGSATVDVTTSKTEKRNSTPVDINGFTTMYI